MIVKGLFLLKKLLKYTKYTVYIIYLVTPRTRNDVQDEIDGIVPRQYYKVNRKSLQNKY